MQSISSQLSSYQGESSPSSPNLSDQEERFSDSCSHEESPLFYSNTPPSPFIPSASLISLAQNQIPEPSSSATFSDSSDDNSSVEESSIRQREPAQNCPQSPVREPRASGEFTSHTLLPRLIAQLRASQQEAAAWKRAAQKYAIRDQQRQRINRRLLKENVQLRVDNETLTNKVKSLSAGLKKANLKHVQQKKMYRRLWKEYVELEEETDELEDKVESISAQLREANLRIAKETKEWKKAKRNACEIQKAQRELILLHAETISEQQQTIDNQNRMIQSLCLDIDLDDAIDQMLNLKNFDPSNENNNS